MKLIKTTKQGNQHFLLDDGRIGAIYPQTGYVRVSHSIKARRPEYRQAAVERNLKAIQENKTGNLLVYQINPVRKVTKLEPVNQELYYYPKWTGGNTDRPYKFLPKCFFEYETTERLLYPTTESSNNYLRLMEILTKFNYKNCQPCEI